MTPDASNACLPQAVPILEFHAAPGKYQGKCSERQLTRLLGSCLGGEHDTQLCANAKRDLAECSSCVFGTPDEKVGHPIVLYENYGPLPNEGVCMAAFAGEQGAQTDCSAAFQIARSCSFRSCFAACSLVDADSEEAFGECFASAFDSTCAEAGPELASPKCSAAYKSTTTYGFCLNSDDSTNVYLQYASFICGFAPSDAGTDDAGDAGDAGDADATPPL